MDLRSRPLGRFGSALLLLSLVAVVGVGAWFAVQRRDGDAATAPSVPGESVAPASPRLSPREDEPSSSAEASSPEEEVVPEEPDSDPDSVRWDETITITVVAEDDGTPVEGASVRTLVSWRPEEFRAGVTDATGRARLEAPDRGAVVWIRARGFVAQEKRAGDHHSAPPDTVEIRLARGRPLAGRVVRAADGAAASDAEVYVWNAVSEKEVESAPERLGNLRDGGLSTDREGRFEVAGLPPGVPVTIVARAPGLGLAVLRLSATDTTSEVMITLGDGGILSGAVELDGKGPAVGVLVFAVTAGDESRLRHPDARWLAGGDVRLSAVARTDERGRYRIEGLRLPARYVAVAVGEEYAKGASDAAVLKDRGDHAVRDVHLVTPAWLRVKGFAPDGSPVAIEDCDLATLDGAPVPDPFFSGSASYTVGSNEYSLDTRPPGKWLLLARATAPWGPARVPVELLPGEHKTLEVAFAPGCSIAGLVVDASDRPVEGARITSGHRTTYRHATSDETGRFRLDGLAAGGLTVEVETKDGFRESARVETTCPTTAVLRVVLGPRPEVVGRVDVPPGFSNEVVGRIRTADHVRRVWPRTDADGSFRLPHVRSGERFDLTLWCRDGGAPRVFRDLRADVGARLDLGVVRLVPGRSVEGTVVDERGAPLASALVEPDETVRAQQARTDVAGRFRLDAAPDAPFTVVVRAPGRPAVMATIGAEGPALIRCPIGVLVRGRLTGAPDDLLADRRLRFVPRVEDGSAALAVHDMDTDSIGSFETRLPTGAYDVFTVVQESEDPRDRAVESLDRLDARIGVVVVEGSTGADVTLRLPGA